PRTNEPPHWTRPKLVAQVKFGEWTDDGVLRQPVYLGLRDDVKPETVRREQEPTLRAKSVRVSAGLKPGPTSTAGLTPGPTTNRAGRHVGLASRPATSKKPV